MGREKRAGPAALTAKDKARKRKEIDRKAPLPSGLKAMKDTNTKYKSFFELVQNKDFKSKPLEFEKTSKRDPPPLFAFVPVGNPELAVACKELSRERGAMVYIVSETRNQNISDLVHQTNRIGYHFRQQIVQEAARTLGIDYFNKSQQLAPNGCELIPSSQVEINNQARAAIDDLFPKMPGLDKEEIVARAFRKNAMFNGELVVGMQQDLTLSRRVQLAVLAHIRHGHTRYDELLRETTWSNARRATEALCLDILVKWRGDDESGRDQLDEIMREIVVVTDDEGDDEPEGAIDEPDSDSSSGVEFQGSNPIMPNPSTAPGTPRNNVPNGRAGSTKPQRKARKKQGIPVKSAKSKKALLREQRNAQRSLKRYEVAWNQALDRQRAEPAHQGMSMPNGSASHGSYSQGYSGDPTPYTSQAPPPSVFHESSQQGYTLGYAQSGVFVEPRRPTFFRPPPPLPEPNNPEPDRPAFEPANEFRPQFDGYSTVPSNQRPAEGYRLPLQDMLHPSVEQPSPQRPSFGHSEGSPMTSTYREASLAQSIAANRDGRRPLLPERPAYLDQGHAPRDWHEPRQPQTDLREPVFSSMPGPSTAYRPDTVSYGDSGAHFYDSRVPLVQQRHRLGHISESGFSQPQSIQREVIVLREGQSTRDPYGADGEIIGFRPQPPQAHGSSMPEGFVRLREEAPAGPLRGLPRDEGFVRLRESPQIWRDLPTVYDGHSRGAAQPSHQPGFDDGYRRLGAAPNQFAHVRRVEPGFSSESPYAHGRHPHEGRYEGTPSQRLYGLRPIEYQSRQPQDQYTPLDNYPTQPMSAGSSSNGYVIDDREYTPRTPFPPDRQVIIIDS